MAVGVYEFIICRTDSRPYLIVIFQKKILYLGGVELMKKHKLLHSPHS